MSRIGDAPRRRRWRLSAALLAALTVVGACGNSNGDDDSAPASDVTTGTESGGDDVDEAEVDDEEAADGDEVADSDGAEPAEGNGEFEPIEGVPGVSDDAINFAVLSTGAANPLGYCLLDCIVDGVEAYFAWRNSEGGVNGRQLVLSEIVDDELVNNQVRALELIDSDEVFAVISEPIVASGFADLAAASVPVYTNAVPSVEANGVDSIFPYPGVVCGTCPNRFSVYGPHLAGATRVGSLGYGVSQASKDCVDAQVASFEEWGDDVGIEHVYAKNDLAYGLPNGLGPEVTAMKEAGVDFVLTCIDQNGALILDQELERQGMGDVAVSLPQAYANYEFIEFNADVLEGDILAMTYRPLEADPGDSDMGLFLEWMEATGSEISDHALEGWLNADLAYQGILAAGPQFDRDSVVEATNQMTDYTAGGMQAPVDWTRQHDASTPEDPASGEHELDCAAYVQIVDGEFVLLTPEDEPWVCWESADQTWSEPTPMDFD